MIKYKRILLKLSGESLMGEQQYGIDQKRLNDYAEQIAELGERWCSNWNCNWRRKYFSRIKWCHQRISTG